MSGGGLFDKAAFGQTLNELPNTNSLATLPTKAPVVPAALEGSTKVRDIAPGASISGTVPAFSCDQANDTSPSKIYAAASGTATGSPTKAVTFKTQRPSRLGLGAPSGSLSTPSSPENPRRPSTTKAQHTNYFGFSSPWTQQSNNGETKMQHGNKIFVTETKNEDEEIISTTKNTKFYHFLKNAQLSPSVERNNSSWKLVGTVSVAVVDDSCGVCWKKNSFVKLTFLSSCFTQNERHPQTSHFATGHFASVA